MRRILHWRRASDGLTNREAEIRELVGRGMTSTEIARVLFVSRRTVDFHRANLRRKLRGGG
jgi:two-component system, NarL family, response regulator NreC